MKRLLGLLLLLVVGSVQAQLVPDYVQKPATVTCGAGTYLQQLTTGRATCGSPPGTTYTADETSLHLSAGVFSLKALTGDLTTSAGAVATTLATVNSNVGTYGSSSAVAQVTVNAKGLTTAAGNVTISVSALWPVTAENASFNAAKDNIYAITGNAVTATMPASPTQGDQIWFIVEYNVTGFTVGRNGNEIMNASTDMTVTQEALPYTVKLIYDTNMGWTIMALLPCFVRVRRRAANDSTWTIAA